MCDENWREIYFIEPDDRYFRGMAVWNKEMHVCVLFIRDFHYMWQPYRDIEPPMQEAQCFNTYIDAIEWARVRLPEMWQAWKTWYDANKEQEKQSG